MVFLNISIRQIFLLFVAASFSLAVRVTPELNAAIAGQAGWVSVILSCLIYTVMIIFLARLFKNQNNLDLYGLFNKVLGRFLCNALTTVYALWIFILLSMHLRSAAERYMTAFFPAAPLSFFVISLLAICFIILQGKFACFVKMGEIAFYLILAALFIVFTVAVHQIKFENFLPVTTMDAMPVVKGIYTLLGVLSIFTFVLFAGDEFADKDKFKRYGLQSGAVLTVINIAIFLLTVGIFGSNLTQRFTLPFLMAEKSIKFFGSIERMESLDMLAWLISDVLVIGLLAYILISIISKMTGIKNKTALKSPILLGAYIFSLFIVKNIFEIKLFAQYIELYMNIVFGLAIPVAVFMIGKMRGRV